MTPLIWSWVIVVGLLIVVDLYARSGSVSRIDLVPITEMATRSAELVGDGAFLRDDLAWTLGVILASFATASLLGVSIAYVMSESAWARSALVPYLEVFYAVPTFAIYPVIVVLFGSGALPIGLLATAFASVVIISNSLVGFTSIPTMAVKLSTSLRLSRGQHLRLILLPAALTHILTGLKLGLNYAIIAVVVSEFILSAQGLGHFVANAYNTFDTVDMYAGIVLVAAFAVVVNALLNFALARFDWNRR